VIRWIKFNTVGLMGVAVQLSTLALLTRVGVNYLAATALAVEVAVLHNYWWHRRWTWREHSMRERPGRLWRFQVSNGLMSMVSNLVLMRVLAGWVGLPVVPANLIVIACMSLVNFWISECWVFSPVNNRLAGHGPAPHGVVYLKFLYRARK
jgi:putative flippase GtrA